MYHVTYILTYTQAHTDISKASNFFNILSHILVVSYYMSAHLSFTMLSSTDM